MCNISGIIFCTINLLREEIEGKKIIELGSYNVSGSIQPIIKSLGPAEYVGVDIEKGQAVDVICNAENIVEKFGKESFDIVISTELLEHVRDWRKVISNIKNICKTNGIILVTTRSYGFGYHGFPQDFWRYELEDMKNIFLDCEILTLEKDTEMPGVFIKVKKPSTFVENDLSAISLYSMVVNKRVKEITDRDFLNFWLTRSILKYKLRNFLLKVYKFVFSKI